ncbi:hypothetical protein [Vibrio pelagius]|uniref:hypothetical protein n=1 Tax=Vibrio pelagius TaxID=28169 RepID=UPI003551D11A
MSKKAKVIYISIIGMSEPLGKSQVLEYLKSLSSYHDLYLHTFEKDTSDVTINEIKNIMDSYDIKWSFQKYNNKFGLFSSFFQILSSAKLILDKINSHKIDLIHARSNIPVLIALILKGLTGVKVLFDIRGFQIDEKAEVGRIKKDGLLYKVLKRMELFAYKKSDTIVSLTENSKNIISNVTDSSKITVIPTCANKNVFSYNQDVNFKMENGYNTTDKVIIHAGTVSNWYDFDSELVLIKSLMEKDNTIKLLILNKGEHNYILNKLNEYDIEKNKVKVQEVSFYEMHKYLSFADASLFLIKPTFSKKASAPTKFAENLCCNLFSITNDNIGDMNKFISEYPDVGFSFELGEIKTNLEKLSSDILIRMNSASKESKQYQTLYQSHFDGEMAVQRYSELYKKMANIT